MIYYLIKVLITAFIIVLATEVSKRDTFLGGLVISIPIVSYLTFIWLYIDTSNTERIADLSMNVFWLVIPSLSLFVMLSWLLRSQIGFFISLLVSTAVMIALYFVMSHWVRPT